MVAIGEFPNRVEMIRQENEGLNGKRAFSHFSFERVVDSCNIGFFGQDLLTSVGDQGEKEIPAGLFGTPIVHVEVLGTLRFAQPTMLLFSIRPGSSFRVPLIYFLADLTGFSSTLTLLAI